jgi:hypothetical protein
MVKWQAADSAGWKIAQSKMSKHPRFSQTRPSGVPASTGGGGEKTSKSIPPLLLPLPLLLPPLPLPPPSSDVAVESSPASVPALPPSSPEAPPPSSELVLPPEPLA